MMPGQQISLRAAIDAVNASMAPSNQITFDIDPTGLTGPAAIFLTSPLPSITKSSVTIDGTTQADTNPAGPDVAIDGGQLTDPSGVQIQADHDVFHGLIVRGFQIARGDGTSGISIEGSDNQFSDNELVDNNVDGLEIVGDRNQITGNAVTRNTYDRVRIVGNENLISNNEGFQNNASGIEIEGSDNRLDSNKIMDNRAAGIIIASGDRNQIVSNEIAFNHGPGIVIGGGSSTAAANSISRNVIHD